MKSYISIDSIEGKFVVCEVELIPIEESKPEDFAHKETEMMDIPLQNFDSNLGEVKEGDIFVVEHDGENVSCVYYKDEDEKARRVELIRKIMNKN